MRTSLLPLHMYSRLIIVFLYRRIGDTDCAEGQAAVVGDGAAAVLQIPLHFVQET